MSEAGRIRPGKAIATVYNGITFRSRKEADVAFLLDELGMRWKYEPHSFLLPSGDHYAPDFLIEDRRTWVEPRGYRDLKGDRQLSEFAHLVHEGRVRFDSQSRSPKIIPATSSTDDPATGELMDFLVLGPDRVAFHEPQSRFGATSSPARLLRCGRCGAFSFIGLGGWEACRSAACSSAGRPYHPDEKWPITLERGKILIAGDHLRSWIAEARAQKLLPPPRA